MTLYVEKKVRKIGINRKNEEFYSIKTLLYRKLIKLLTKLNATAAYHFFVVLQSKRKRE